eukprot:5586611-Alexandrium_andersonii.AAC.1
MLDSPDRTVQRLAQKLDPDEYSSEADIDKLLTFLEQSLLGRMPLSDAGNRLSAYFRVLSRT